ncbi:MULTISPECIES: ABC transporter permease [Chelativorans]|jgi:peptide/nickel transport system permease protein|uniref:Binding-protein-dependent transport systems inner membrane component n=1 Tax=Chelativorans sp. (strain BNC1) TaxID=266779 RepID=Q11F23_CHESB|nr:MULTISPECIES: ABC transporter permease [Chelativorans]
MTRNISILLNTLRRTAQYPSGAIGLALVTTILLVALFAPLLAPYDPNKLDLVNRLSGVSAEHWLGTDQLGRDLLSRHIYGTQVAVVVALSVIAIALAIGMTLGILSAYVPGPIERFILISFDSVSSFPSVILAMAAVAVLGSSMPMLIIVIATSLVPHYGRVARAQVLSVKNEPYIEAETVFGASELRILFFHIVPNILAPLIVIASLDIPIVIAIEASLSFLGLGLRPPLASWGGLLQDGYQNISKSVLPVLISSTALAIATLAFTMFGEALRHAIDPRSQRGGKND